MEQHSSENLRLIAYGNFSKIITFWTEKLYKNNQAWRLGEANEVVAWSPTFQRCCEDPPFGSFALRSYIV